MAHKILTDLEAKELRKLLQRPEYVYDAEFRKVLDVLVTLVLEHGVSRVPATRKDGSFGFDDDDHRERFITSVHDGWKKAQEMVLDELSARLPQRTALKSALAEARKSRDAKVIAHARYELGMCEAQMLSLRRVLDSICWSLLNGQHHVVRRLHMRESPWSLTIEKINGISPVLQDVNRQPHVMAVACDATTFFQTHDLLVMDRGPGGGLRFVEVKSGEKNWEIVSKAHQAVDLGCDRFNDLSTHDMNVVDRKHFERAKRQAERSRGIDEVLKSGRGTDHNTGAAVHIGEIPEAPAHFDDKVANLFDAVSVEQQWAIDVVDGCLFMGAYRDPRLVFGFCAWIRGEQNGVLRVVSLLDTAHDFLACPMLSLPLPVKHIRRLVATDVTFVMSLDVEKLIAQVNASVGYEALFLETPAKSRRAAAGKEGYILAQQDGRLIGARSNEGVTMYLGEGALDRIFFDFQTPVSVGRSMVLTTRDYHSSP